MIDFHKKRDPREFVNIIPSDFEPVFHYCSYFGGRIESDRVFSHLHNARRPEFEKGRKIQKNY